MSDDTITNEKDKQQNGKIYFEMIYLIKDLSPEYIQNNSN